MIDLTPDHVCEHCDLGWIACSCTCPEDRYLFPPGPPWRFAVLGDGIAAEIEGVNAYGIPAILRAEFTETHASAVLRSLSGSQWYAAVLPADSLQNALDLSETLIAGSGLNVCRIGK